MIITLVEQNSARPEGAGRTYALDLDPMDDADAQIGQLLAKTLMKSSQPKSATNPKARDSIEYTLTIEHEGKPESYKSDATSVSQEFADLLKWVKVHLAKQRKRSGGT